MWTSLSSTMRLLLTGGKGFVGQHASSVLSKEGHVVLLGDIVGDGPKSEHLDVTQNLDNSFRSLKPDAVLHLAALAGSRGRGGGVESISDPHNYFLTNLLGTLNVFEACRQNKIAEVVHMSSFSPYGVSNTIISENTVFDPTNPYGFSKAGAELIAKCYAINYGIKTVILRAPLICGEGQKEMNAIREFVSSVLENRPILVRQEGKHRREWLHPIDVGRAFAKSLTYLDKMGGAYETFVLGSDPISMNDLAKLVIKRVGKGRIQYSTDSSNVFDQHTDHSKARKILGWEPKISVEEIIDRVKEDFIDNHPHSTDLARVVG